MKNFVDYKWLMDNMEEENLIILDARASLSDPLEGEKAYEKSHIKGAHFVSLEKTSTGPTSKHGGRHPLPNLKNFVENMRKLGINNSSKIVIYDDGSLAMAARLWWILKYVGKDDVYILEGGIDTFSDQDGPISSSTPEVEKEGNLSLNVDENMLVDMNYVREKIHDNDTAIVDARAYERYIGEFEPWDPIAGHIKNALNYPWTELVKDGKIIGLKEAKEKFKDLKDYEEILVHCGSGITGIVNLLVWDEIGIDSTLYLGGYSDWISYDENEVVVGEE